MSYECEECGKSFKSAQSLGAHVRWAHIKPPPGPSGPAKTAIEVARPDISRVGELSRLLELFEAGGPTKIAALKELAGRIDLRNKKALADLLVEQGVSDSAILGIARLFYSSSNLRPEDLGLHPPAPPGGVPPATTPDTHATEFQELKATVAAMQKRDEQREREETDRRKDEARRKEIQELKEGFEKQLQALADKATAPPPPPPAPSALVKETFETFASLRSFMEGEGFHRGPAPPPPPSMLDTLIRTPGMLDLAAGLAGKAAALLDAKLKESQAKTDRIIVDGEIFYNDMLKRDLRYQESQKAATVAKPTPPPEEAKLAPLKPPVPASPPPAPTGAHTPPARPGEETSSKPPGGPPGAPAHVSTSGGAAEPLEGAQAPQGGAPQKPSGAPTGHASDLDRPKGTSEEASTASGGAP